MTPAFWLCAATTTTSSLVSLGYSAAAIRTSSAPGQTNARYAFSRSVALTTVSVVAVSVRSNAWLEAAAVAMTVVQTGDAVIGLLTSNRLKTLGPALTATANLAALINLVR